MKEDNRHMPFAIPRVWREPRNHNKGECYFCSVQIFRGSKKNIYPDTTASRAPIPHSTLFPVP